MGTHGVEIEAARPVAHAAVTTRRRALFVGSLYAGHRTRFLNLREHTQAHPALEAEYRTVSGWVEDGRIERLPLPRGVRGRLRALVEAAPLARLPRHDVVWTSVAEAAAPWLLPMIGPLRRPLVLDLDATLEQLDAMSEAYRGRPPRRGLARWRLHAIEELLLRRATAFTPWSHWAADGLVSRGVDPARIHVLPPGVDLEAWRIDRPAAPRSDDGPLRLLFVGGNFERKGGDLLLDAMRGPLRDRCHLDVVTHDDVAPTPGVSVHRATPNSPELRRLFEAADLFVMPTRADCFGIACVEAMAAGLPVVMGDIGGARDIVDDGRTGWLIPARLDELVRVLDHAIDHRDELPGMGRAARAVAEERFDGRRNDEAIVELLLDQAARHAR